MMQHWLYEKNKHAIAAVMAASIISITPARSTCKPPPDVIVAYDKLRFDDVHDVIGRGAFATVYKARHVDWGCYVAYKNLNVNVDYADDLQPM